MRSEFKVNLTRPAGALKDAPISVFDEMFPVSGLAVKPPLRVHFNVRVADDNHLKKNKEHRDIICNVRAVHLQSLTQVDLSLLLLQVALQADRVREQGGVPGEIPLLVRVVDIEPDDVIGDVVAIESGVHGLHVSLVSVVPATLMVAESEEWGEGLKP